jgi:hypothetical protein
MRWCERYLLPGTALNCTAADLYAARCTVLHTYTSKSALSRSGKAREMIYAWGDKTARELQRIVDIAHRATHVAVHIETLAKSFENAVHTFLKDALADPKRVPLLEARAREFFISYERIV